MFPGFYGGCNGFGGCGGWGGGWGWGFGGPCGKCGHCCYCNRNSNLTMLALAAMCCRDGGHRGFLDGGFFKGFGGFGFPGALAREEKKERICEDVRSRRGAYSW